MTQNLPFLPGLTEKRNYDWVSRTLQGGKFEKTQVLWGLKQGRTPRELEPNIDDMSSSSGYPGSETNITPILSPRQPTSPRLSLNIHQNFRSTTATITPRFAKNDKIILRFIGYFEEKCQISLVGKHSNSSIIRKLQFQYYADDCTLYIVEKADNNSGLQNGVFFGRSRGMKTDGTLVGTDDLITGNTLNFLGRDIFMSEADEFTKEYYLRELDRDISTFIPPPFTQAPPPVASPPTSPREATESSKAFLEHDKQVLRFYGKRRSDSIEVVILYYLSDGTVELLRRTNKNCPLTQPLRSARPQSSSSSSTSPRFKAGRQLLVGQTTTILRRQVVPKDWTQHNDMITDQLVEMLAPTDFPVGRTVNIFGNEVVIQSCDVFSMQYCSANYPQLVVHLDNDDDDDVVHKHVSTSQEQSQICQRQLLVQKRKYDNIKIMLLLTSVSELNQMNREDGHKFEPRRFILQYYLEDDSFSIFEEMVANIGCMAGRFLKRGIHKDPRTEAGYRSSDLFIGARIMLPNAYEMEITDMDLTSHDLLASYKEDFPLFDVDVICQHVLKTASMNQMQAILGQRGNNMLMEKQEFNECVLRLAPNLARQELISLERGFRVGEMVHVRAMCDMMLHIIARNKGGSDMNLVRVRGDWRKLMTEKLGGNLGRVSELLEYGVDQAAVNRIVELAANHSNIDDICDRIYCF